MLDMIVTGRPPHKVWDSLWRISIIFFLRFSMLSFSPCGWCGLVCLFQSVVRRYGRERILTKTELFEPKEEPAYHVSLLTWLRTLCRSMPIHYRKKRERKKGQMNQTELAENHRGKGGVKGCYQWWARYDKHRLSMRGQSQHNSHGHVAGGRRTLLLRRRNGGPRWRFKLSI